MVHCIGILNFLDNDKTTNFIIKFIKKITDETFYDNKILFGIHNDIMIYYTLFCTYFLIFKYYIIFVI